MRIKHAMTATAIFIALVSITASASPAGGTDKAKRILPPPSKPDQVPAVSEFPAPVPADSAAPDVDSVPVLIPSVPPAAVSGIDSAPMIPSAPSAAQAFERSEKRIVISNSGQKMKYTDARTFSGKIANGPGKTLHINASQTKITISGWSGSEVAVEAKIEAGSNDENVLRELLASIELIAEKDGNDGRIEIHSPFEWDEEERSKSPSQILRNIFKSRRISFSFSAVLDIKVPRSQSLDIENSFGDVAIKEVSGRHEINNESGEVKIEACGGSLRLENSFARVSVADFAGDVDIRNESGQVDLRNVSGKADVQNSFNKVTFEKIGGDLTVKSESSGIRGAGVGGRCRIESSFAEIDVRDVTGRLDVKGESSAVIVAEVKSDAVIESSFAPIKVTNIGRSLRITAESSAVTADEVGGDARIQTSFAKVEASRIRGPLTVNCESGPVTLRGIDGDVAVSNSFGSVMVQEVKGSLDVKSESSKVTAADVGGKVSVVTSFNAVEIRRTGAEVKVIGESSPVLVESPGGNVDVSNSFGYVILRGTPGSVLVRGESSSVELSSVKSLPPGSIVDIRTSFGPITVTLPAGIEPRITVPSEFSKLCSDFPVYTMDTGLGKVRVEQRTSHAESARVRGEKDVVAVRLETSNAGIVIKKQK